MDLYLLRELAIIIGLGTIALFLLIWWGANKIEKEIDRLWKKKSNRDIW